MPINNAKIKDLILRNDGFGYWDANVSLDIPNVATEDVVKTFSNAVSGSITCEGRPFDDIFEREIELRRIPKIDRIIVNKKKKATTVIWTDGDVTVVKRAKGDRDEPYFAVASALAIKCFGSNSAFKSIIDDKLVYIGKDKKDAENSKK